jgi:hypothetical protein
VALVSQIASSFVSEEQVKGMVPAIPADAEPVALSLDVGGGRVRSVFVLPTAVLGALAASGARNALAPSQPAPAPAAETPATGADAAGEDAR